MASEELSILNAWFASYLLGRSQVTEVGFNLSTECMISCGVPQGSVLGPLLFLIYINDIHNSSAKLSFYLFADDTSLLYADTNLKSLEKTVNSELLKVSDWLNANKLTLNAKKSNYVIFRPYQRKLNYSVNIEMIDNCTQIPTTLQCKDHVKYLGVLLDSNLRGSLAKSGPLDFATKNSFPLFFVGEEALVGIY